MHAERGVAAIIWLNPGTGISGDMLLGALLDLGAPLDGVRAAVAGTGLTGWSLDVERTTRGGLAATRAVVTVRDSATARDAAELRGLVARARPAPVAALAGRAIASLAEVEAGLHAVPVDRVHLHEIGGHDTVVDTVGVAAALHLLGAAAPDGLQLHCGPLGIGSGSVRTRHGVLPLPAPATAALLARAGAPVQPAGVAGETVTPTGIALLLAAGARFGPLPAMELARVGYGAGTREFDGRPNVLPALLGQVAATVATLQLLETTVDDVTGELLGYLLAQLLAAGAADAWITPIVMKKSRPAHTVHVLVDPSAGARLRADPARRDRQPRPAPQRGRAGRAAAAHLDGAGRGARDPDEARPVGRQARARRRGRGGDRARAAAAHGGRAGPVSGGAVDLDGDLG